ncbi:hypothetical protein D9611_007167 [Ephemerocybe angulata]|uniref:NYN domain-containing protein n=1 Tax=Ephemerocybe angulata TaxID=980116 RepID=A0A8H5B158_9AGAR|nr:hypothetical protein D9611_007167 [Tulosesus angulatus]
MASPTQQQKGRTFIYWDLDSFVVYGENSDQAIHCMAKYLKSKAGTYGPGNLLKFHAHLTACNLLAPGQMSQMKLVLAEHEVELHCFPSQDARDKYVLLNQPNWSEGESPENTIIVLASKHDLSGLAAELRSLGSTVFAITNIAISVAPAPVSTTTPEGSSASKSRMSTLSAQSDTRMHSASGGSSSSISNVIILWDFLHCCIPARQRERDGGSKIIRSFKLFICSKFGDIASFLAYVPDIEDANILIRNAMEEANIDLRCVDHDATLDSIITSKMAVDVADAIFEHSQIKKVILCCKDIRLQILSRRLVKQGLEVVRIPKMSPKEGRKALDYPWEWDYQVGDGVKPADGQTLWAPLRDKDSQDDDADELLLKPGFQAPSGPWTARGNKDVARESTAGDGSDEEKMVQLMVVEDSDSEHWEPSKSRSVATGSMYVPSEVETEEESEIEDDGESEFDRRRG